MVMIDLVGWALLGKQSILNGVMEVKGRLFQSHPDNCILRHFNYFTISFDIIMNIELWEVKYALFKELEILDFVLGLIPLC